MKTYCYDEPAENGENRHIEMTEYEILDVYWESWFEKMQALGRESLISKENCIQDWVTTNWAWEKQPQGE